MRDDDHFGEENKEEDLDPRAVEEEEDEEEMAEEGEKENKEGEEDGFSLD